jgi:hypothetical protein
VIWRPEDTITGERLQALADVTVATPAVLAYHTSLPQAGARECVVFPGDLEGFEPDAASIERLQSCRSIFVYTHIIPSFVKHVLPSLRGRFVLLTHNSDASVDRRFLDVLDDPRLVHWFAQNATLPHSKLSPLPLGIANAQWPHGRISDLLAAAEAAPWVRRRLVYSNFSTHTNRLARVPLRWRLALSRDVLRTGPKPFREYLSDLAQCQWCLSPPGNGPDCHRTWESLYVGTVPLVRYIQGLDDVYAGLPVIRYTLSTLSRSALEAAQSRLEGLNFDLGRLTMDYWRRRVAEKVALT